jgi:hypothetical protein
MLSFRASSGTVGQRESVREVAKRLDMPPPISVRALIETLVAAKEIADFHAASWGILTVGSPAGPVERTVGGGFQQPYSFGSIIKPAGVFPDVGKRFHVTVTLAGVRCFGTDDPGFVLVDPHATDEPYLITSVFAIDPREKDKSSQTTRIGPVDGVGSGDVFGQNSDLAVDIAVPGDSDIAMSVQLFDQEAFSNPEKAKQAISDANTAAILGGVAVLTALVPPAGAVAAGVVALLKASGLLDAFSDGIGSVIAALFSDDHLGTIDLRITHQFLETLRDNPTSLDRKSDAIGGETYNFPQLPEDDSEVGRSWMFRQEGKGTYRPFFRVVLTEA